VDHDSKILRRRNFPVKQPPLRSMVTRITFMEPAKGISIKLRTALEFFGNEGSLSGLAENGNRGGVRTDRSVIGPVLHYALDTSIDSDFEGNAR
jgi:hypothetical protein